MSNQQGYFQFADAATHFDLLHGQHGDKVSVCTVVGGKLSRKTIDHDAARLRTISVASDYETYLSQSAFNQSARRATVGDVSYLNGHWVDLDIYNTVYAGKTDDEMLALVNKQCPWLPRPTMVINSGRGYHFLWLFLKPVQADCLAVWQNTQDAITDLLKPVGADPATRDAARVLRVAGSTNSKSGTVVTGVRDTGPGVDFAQFARLVKRNNTALAVVTNPLPQPKQQPNQKQPKQKRKPRTYASAETANRARLNDYELAQDRMGDYRTLAELRGAPLRDCRHRLLYEYACSGAWFWGGRDHATYELNEFSRQYFAGHSAYGAKRCQTVLDRMVQAKSGGVAQIYDGEVVDWRYKSFTASIIRKLEITDAEQREMKTLILKSEKARRRSENKDENNRRRRIREGRATRDKYIAEREAIKQERLQAAKALRDEGYRQTDIAQKLGLSRSEVSRLLSGKRG